jgi:hypothetical protein
MLSECDEVQSPQLRQRKLPQRRIGRDIEQQPHGDAWE